MHSSRMCTVTGTDIQRRHIAYIATIGETAGAIMSGGNAKNAANENGAGMNGESMSVVIETAGATATTGDTKPSGSNA